MNTSKCTCPVCHAFLSPEEINHPDDFKEIFPLSDCKLKTSFSINAAIKEFIIDCRGH